VGARIRPIGNCFLLPRCFIWEKNNRRSLIDDLMKQTYIWNVSIYTFKLIHYIWWSRWSFFIYSAQNWNKKCSSLARTYTKTFTFITLTRTSLCLLVWDKSIKRNPTITVATDWHLDTRDTSQTMWRSRQNKRLSPLMSWVRVDGLTVTHGWNKNLKISGIFLVWWKYYLSGHKPLNHVNPW
jgi:hypothetical protein